MSKYRKTKAKNREAVAAYRARQRASGKCIECGEKAAKGKVRCKVHLALAADGQRNRTEAKISEMIDGWEWEWEAREMVYMKRIAELESEIWKLRDQLATRRPLYLPGETWWGLGLD